MIQEFEQPEDLHPYEIELAKADKVYEGMEKERLELRYNNNVPLNWGIRKKDIESLRKGSHSNSPIENLFYGSRNLRIPTEIMDLSNPSEILGLYISTGALKKYNSHKSNDQIPRDSFSTLVNFMNQIAYSNPIFPGASQDFERTFSKNPGDQKRRLAEISGESKRLFCRSFWSNYLPSLREEPTHPEAFVDPQNWDSYVNFTWQGIKRSYGRAHWENIKP